MTSATVSLPAGTRLGSHEIRALIGAGGMGEVYRATDTRLGRDVAIKVLPAGVAGDAERLARFEREAKLLASLNHPNIAHVYGFESANLPDRSTVHFLVMELVEGEELAERVERGPIPAAEALEIAKQIAEALEEAHEKGIVHRDLKPANVKVAPDGKVKVAGGIMALKGASWGDDGWIYYSPAPAMGLWRVRAEGGAPEELTRPDASKGEKTHRRPSVVPGGRTVLFVVGTSRMGSFNDARIEALSLPDRVRHRLIEGGTNPRYVAALGDLVYERGGKLISVPFDPERLSLRGSPTTVAEGVADMPESGLSYHSVSDNGTLAWLPRAAGAPSASIVAMDLGGRATKLADAPFMAATGSLSPDGARLAVDRDGACEQIAIIDLARNRTQQVTFEWDNSIPLWTPDGSRLIYRSNLGGGVRQLYWQAADGSGVPERLASGDRERTPDSVSGRVLAFEELDPKTAADIHTLSLDDRTIQVLLRTPFDESGARFSPDGRFVAYQSNQSGRWEVYVEAYPTDGRRTQVSFAGGARPRWLPSGQGLVYLRGLDLMTASLTMTPAVRAGAARRVASLEPLDTLLDVAPDGRLLVLRRESDAPATRLGLCINWFEEVRRLKARSAE